MDIEFKCSSCGIKVVSLDKYKGQKINCPHCSSEVVVPEVSDIKEAKPEKIPQKEPTEIEKATEQIKSELSSIKFYLLIILLATVVIAIITILYYRDYCKVKEAVRDSLQEVSNPYKY